MFEPGGSGALELSGLFDGPVVALAAAIDASTIAGLGPREAELVARAVPKRQREFATARWLAREALARLGAPAAEILQGERGAPIWPPGVTGSLTHCARYAAAAVGHAEAVGTLGIDVEDREVLPEELWPRVLTDAERRALDRRPAASRGRWALLAFSAKESLYKAQFPRTRQFMNFTDAEVHLRGVLSRGALTCVFLREVGAFPLGHAVDGRFVELAEAVVTAVRIPNVPAFHETISRAPNVA